MEQKWIYSEKWIKEKKYWYIVINNKYNETKYKYNETKYKFKWIINNRDINNDHDNDNNNRKGFNKQLQRKN